MDGKGHIEGWTAEEVVEFLATLDLDQYSDDFLGNGITGDILVHLDHEALRDIGVESVGHRLNILRAVYNIKVSDNVTIEAEHYVPATVDFESSNRATTTEIAKDLTAITEAIQVRDERLLAAETEIKRLTELLSRLKDQLTPVFKIVKELQPLPQPDSTAPASSLAGSNNNNTTSSSSIVTLAPPTPVVSRKFSTKKLFLGSALKQPSPTHVPSNYLYASEPESPRSPIKPADLPPLPPSSSTSSRGGATAQHMQMHNPLDPGAPGPSNANTLANSTTSTTNPPTRSGPPPRPPPPGNSSATPPALMSAANISRRDSALPATPNDTIQSPGSSSSNNNNNNNNSSGGGGGGGGGGGNNSSTVDAFKSFRVGLDDSCSTVLPVALKKYKINSDWREYSLFICYADQERCLRMDEKPLLIFQQLQRANKSPVFMLRKIEGSEQSAAASLAGAGSSGASSGRHDQEMRF